MSSGDPIREYILMNRERYTREAIDTKLRESNYSPSDIEAAWQSLRDDEQRGSGDPARAPERHSFRSWFVPYVSVLNLAVFALFAFFSELEGSIFLVILAVVLLLGAIIGYFAVSRTGAARKAAQGITAGLAVALLVPFVITVVIAGVCIQTTRPAFG